MLPKLAIIICDLLNGGDRIKFQISLNSSTTKFKKQFIFLGSKENYKSYTLKFDEHYFDSDFKKSILSFLCNANEFDYYVIISPRILLNSNLNSDTIDLTKIMFYLNKIF